MGGPAWSLSAWVGGGGVVRAAVGVGLDVPRGLIRGLILASLCFKIVGDSLAYMVLLQCDRGRA